MDSTNNTGNEIPLLNEGNHGLGYPAGQFGRSTSSATGQSSPDSDPQTMLTSEAVVHDTRRWSEAGSNLLQKRQFYHSRTLQPMTLEEVMSDQDSEDEMMSDQASEDRQMLDDISDVNKTEKIFMHLWTSFVRKERVVADGHLPWACESFSKIYKKELIPSSPLFWCWRLFMIKLWNLGLIKSTTVNKCHIVLENCDDNSYNNSSNNNYNYNSNNNNSSNNNNNDENNNNNNNKSSSSNNNNNNVNHSINTNCELDESPSDQVPKRRSNRMRKPNRKFL